MAERARRVNERTLVTFYAVLRSFCRWCVERGYLATNPTDGLAKPKQRRPPHRYLTADQLRAMYQACVTDDERLIMLLCGGSGLRAQEFRTLRWRDIDTTHGAIRVLGKGKKWRELAPGQLAMTILAGLDRSRSVTGIASNEGLRYHVRGIAKRAGIPHCTTHMLRHSFALSYLSAGGSAFALQDLLGHASDLMTRYYVRDQAASISVEEQRRVGLGDRLFGD
jgi:integrase